MRETLNRLSSRKLMIGFAALLVLGLMAGLAFANSGSELPDISGSPPPATASAPSEMPPTDAPASVVPADATDEESGKPEEDADEHSTVGSEGVYERDDVD